MQHQAGVTLIENLVAIVVVAVGLLGMAGLLTQTLKLSGKAQYQTQAVNTAQMVSSSAFALANNATILSKLDGLTFNNAPIATMPTGLSVALTTALKEWASYSTSSMPGATGSLAVISASAGGGTCTALPCILTVTMAWNGSDHVPQSYVTSQTIGY